MISGLWNPQSGVAHQGQGASEEGLQELVSSFGPARCEIPTDPTTNLHKGVGYCTFDDPDAASDAAARLNGSEYDQRAIRVNLMRSK